MTRTTHKLVRYSLSNSLDRIKKRHRKRNFELVKDNGNLKLQFKYNKKTD